MTWKEREVVEQNPQLQVIVIVEMVPRGSELIGVVDR